MARKRNVDVRDLMRIRMVSDPQISADGSRVAFVHTAIDHKQNEYVSDIWLGDIEEGRAAQFTSSRGKDKNPRWSPDGRSLLFTSIPPGKEDEKRKPQRYLIPLDGGEAKQLTEMEGGVKSPRWSPDGRRITFISAHRKEKPEGDVKVIKRVRYRYNPEGFFNGRRKHLFTIRARGGKPKQITEGEFDVDAAEWLVDGRSIAFVSNLDEDADLTLARYIYAVDREGGDPQRLTDGPSTITALKPSPRGDAIAYIGHDFRRGLATNQNIWVVSAEGGESRNLTRAFDQDIGKKPSCDIRVASPNQTPQWSADAEEIYFSSTYGGVSRLYKVSNKGGEVEPILGDVDYGIESWSMSKDGVIAYTTLETTAPIELWVMGDGEPRKITDFNRRWRNRLSVCNHDRFEFRSSAGHVVEGWLMRPPDFREESKYPLVLEIHGGPRSIWGYSLMHEFQVLAAQGWVVVYVNPLGSGGYHEEFQAGQPGHYGEQDYADLMEAVDHVLSHYGFIDPDRLGVTGGSYGGYMTNWIVTHTDRFRAAVTQRSISNWMSMFGCSDIGWTFGRWEIDGIPWADEEKYMAKSPIRHVENVKTPTLIIHSEEDYRCPIEQAEQFFTALKFLGVPTELVRFQGENHDLSRSGKPKNREQRINHIIRWFKTYL